MKKYLLGLAVALLLGTGVVAQYNTSNWPTGTACPLGTFFFGTDQKPYACSPTGVWWALTRSGDATTLPTHASTHQNGGADEIATATAGANAIPKAGAGGTLAVGWIPTRALVHATPANQTGNATATLKMNGLGAAAAACVITPTSTGRVVFTITGQRAETTTADGTTILMVYGTGTPPANAAAATGTIISATQTWTGLTGQLTDGFAITSAVTGLAISTAVWFDLQIARVTGGTATVTNTDCTAYEV